MQISRAHFAWLGLAISIGMLVYLSSQANFPLTFFTFSGAFLCYLMIYFCRNDLSLKHWEYLALVVYLIPVLSIPTLSPDFYRFLWDGELTTYGVHPYAYTPNEIVEKNLIPLDSNMSFLYENITALSKKHYSPYPTINQLYFIIPAWITDHVLMALIIMRLLIFGSLIIGYRFLKKLLIKTKVPLAQGTLLLFNPFLIIEVMDNLHFEGVMMAWLIVGFYYLQQKQWLKGSLLWGVAVAVKLTPLILMPPLIRFFSFKRTFFIYVLVLSFSASLTMLMLWPEYAANVMRSIRLYFNNFEFNASALEIIKWIVNPFTKYSATPIAGPITVAIGTVLLFTLSWWKPITSWKALFTRFMWLYIVYLIFATTVHPWYIILPLVFSIFSTNKGVLVWSFLIMLSYGFYHWDTTWVSHALVITEYIGLALALSFGQQISRFLTNCTQRFST